MISNCKKYDYAKIKCFVIWPVFSNSILNKMQPNDNSLRLTIDSVEFNNLVEWLDELVNSHGVLIENLDLSKDDKSGFVRVSRLVLEK